MNTWFLIIAVVVFITVQFFLYNSIKREFGQKGLIIAIFCISAIIAVLLLMSIEKSYYYLLYFVIIEVALFSVACILKIKDVKEKKIDTEIGNINGTIKNTSKIKRPSTKQLECIYSFFQKHELVDDSYALSQFLDDFLVSKMRLHMDVPSLRYFFECYTKSIDSIKVGVFRNYFINAKTGEVYDEKQFSNNIKKLPILQSEIDELMTVLMGIHSN